MASYDVSKLILPNGDECDLKDAEAREDLDNAKAKLDGMGMVSYGTCSTSADAQVKVVTISNNNWQLKIGSIIGVKYSNTNTYSATASAPVKLNVNGTGEKQIYYSGSATPTGTNTTAFGYVNQYRYYMYDGTYWVFMGLSYHDNTFPSAYCSTSSSTAAKGASCSGYQLLAKSYLHIVVTNANTSANALTLNVNGRGAKPIYINGAASSSSNYTLPAGSYIIYYDGTNYYFRTDGKLTADITGTASNVNGIIIMDSTTRTIVDGTRTFDVSGLTVDHVVARWQFSGNYTDNYPPADITVTTSNGSYTITASNLMSEGITMQPIFIKP